MTTINRRMYQRRDVAVDWVESNPILGPGEIGLESDTSKLKVGDGFTHWNALPYSVLDSLSVVTPTANGQVPVSDSTQEHGFHWVTQPPVTAIISAKGDTLVGTGPGALARLPAGANGQVITADSTMLTGVKWAAAAAGGGGAAAAPILLSEWDGHPLTAGEQVIDDFANGVVSGHRLVTQLYDWDFQDFGLVFDVLDYVGFHANRLSQTSAHLTVSLTAGSEIVDVTVDVAAPVTVPGGADALVWTFFTLDGQVISSDDLETGLGSTVSGSWAFSLHVNDVPWNSQYWAGKLVVGLGTAGQPLPFTDAGLQTMYAALTRQALLYLPVYAEQATCQVIGERHDTFSHDSSSYGLGDPLPVPVGPGPYSVDRWEIKHRSSSSLALLLPLAYGLIPGASQITIEVTQLDAVFVGYSHHRHILWPPEVKWPMDSPPELSETGFGFTDVFELAYAADGMWRGRVVARALDARTLHFQPDLVELIPTRPAVFAWQPNAGEEDVVSGHVEWWPVSTGVHVSVPFTVADLTAEGTGWYELSLPGTAALATNAVIKAEIHTLNAHGTESVSEVLTVTLPAAGGLAPPRSGFSGIDLGTSVYTGVSWNEPTLTDPNIVSHSLEWRNAITGSVLHAVSVPAMPGEFTPYDSRWWRGAPLGVKIELFARAVYTSGSSGWTSLGVVTCRAWPAPDNGLFIDRFEEDGPQRSANGWDALWFPSSIIRLGGKLRNRTSAYTNGQISRNVGSTDMVVSFTHREGLAESGSNWYPNRELSFSARVDAVDSGKYVQITLYPATSLFPDTPVDSYVFVSLEVTADPLLEFIPVSQEVIVPALWDREPREHRWEFHLIGNNLIIRRDDVVVFAKRCLPTPASTQTGVSMWPPYGIGAYVKDWMSAPADDWARRFGDLVAPNGTEWLASIANDGTLSTSQIETIQVPPRPTAHALTGVTWAFDGVTLTVPAGLSSIVWAEIMTPAFGVTPRQGMSLSSADSHWHVINSTTAKIVTPLWPSGSTKTVDPSGTRWWVRAGGPPNDFGPWDMQGFNIT